MVLLIRGKPVSLDILSNPEHVCMLIGSNMALVTAANQLKSMAVKKFSGQPDGLLYLHQREMAVVSASDPCVRVLGSDGATSCLVIVLRRISNGDTCMLKYDGCGAGAFVKNCIERMLRLSSQPPSRLGLQLDAHLVGGFQDPSLESMRLTGDVLLAMQASPFEFHLRTACVAHANSRIREEAAFPVIQGVAFCIRRARLTPAEFDDRGPWSALRGARFLGSQSGVACVYDSSVPQRLIIEPFSYRQPQAGGLSLDFLIGLSDDKLVKCFSPCPGQERTAVFARQLRDTLRFVRDHRVPLVDVFGRGGIVETLRPWLPPAQRQDEPGPAGVSATELRKETAA